MVTQHRKRRSVGVSRVLGVASWLLLSVGHFNGDRKWPCQNVANINGWEIFPTGESGPCLIPPRGRLGPGKGSERLSSSPALGPCM